MPIAIEDLTPELRIIKLSGRMDIPGTGEIEMRFAASAGMAKHKVIVDLTEVSFLASIGIRAIVSNAKAQRQRGGQLVIFAGTNAVVTKTLEATGIDTLVPMFATIEEAQKALDE